MNRFLSLFGIAFALVAMVSQAHALQKSQYRTRGAQASYSTYVSTDCGYEALSIWVFEEKTTGNQTSYDSAYVDYQSYDFCTGSFSYGSGELVGASFDINRLNSATLDGTGTLDVQRCTYGSGGGGEGGMGGGVGGASGMGGAGMGGAGGGVEDGGVYEDPCTYGTAPVSVSLDWTGIGETFRERSTSTYVSGGTRYRYTSSGQSREATVVGSVILDGAEVAVGQGSGSLSSNSSGYFEITH